MYKVISPNSFNFDEPAVQQVKISSKGLSGKDLRDFIKRASHKFVDILKQSDLAPGEHPIHVLAIGSTEDYGPNRNGDGFTRSCCKNYHDTFVKHARFYRHHQNKDPSKSYGRVIASEYNPVMHRIELLCGLNATKEAADRNGGLVADKEMQALESGKDIPVSMACKVAFDVCSGCGNKARNRTEYCDEDTCPYGGLKYNMGKVAEDGHILHADNPHPKFIDISAVHRQADRIAYVLGPLEKTANYWLSGAEAAELWGLNGDEDSLAGDSFWLAKLASAKPTCELISFTDPIPLPPGVNHNNRHRVAELIRALAHEKVALCARDYLRLLGVSDEEAETAAPFLEAAAPKVAAELLRDQNSRNILAANPYRASTSTPREGYKKAAKAAAYFYGVGDSHFNKKAAFAAIREPVPVPSVPDTQAIKNIARKYVLFKVASLAAIAQEYPEVAEELSDAPF